MPKGKQFLKTFNKTLWEFVVMKDLIYTILHCMAPKCINFLPKRREQDKTFLLSDFSKGEVSGWWCVLADFGNIHTDHTGTYNPRTQDAGCPAPK